MTKPSRLPEQLRLPLDQRNGYLHVDVRINQTGAGLFMLDTGSTENAVTPLVADRLGLPVGPEGVADGVGGQAKFTYRPVGSMAIENLLLDCNRVATVDLHRFTESFGGVVNGIVGFQAFGRVPFSIDYQESLLTVYEPSRFHPPPGATPHRLWPWRGLPVVQASIGQGHTVLLVIDTGADTHLTLPVTAAAKWPDIVMVPMTSRGQSRGVGGLVPNAQTWLQSIHLFGLHLTRVPVSFELAPPTDPASSILIGRIGHRLLKEFRLTFDTARGRLWVQWRGGGQPLRE